MADPFAAALRNFRAKPPGARPASVARDAPSPADDGTSDPVDEWSLPPRPDQCPTHRRVPRGADVWHLDALGVPRQLLDGNGRVAVLREEREVEAAVRAAGRRWGS